MAPDLVTVATTGLAKATSLSSRAYVTFLAGDGDYVKGVVGLAKGLRKVKSAYPLVVAVLPDVPEEHRRVLVAQGCIVREINPVYPPENQTRFAMAYYIINYSKLRIWEFVEYSKMIYLDGDIQVYDNIDHLFDLPSGYFYAVMDCFCEKTWSHILQYKISYCQLGSSKVHWPTELGPKPPLYFNAGMFVYEPNLSLYHELLATVKFTTPTPFAEQDFLNMFFMDIYKPIPPVYNLVMAMLWRHPENIDLDKVKVAHYCAAFVEYNKMICLDGNVQVYESIDHLFDLPDGCLYAVKDCFCGGLPQHKQCPEVVKWPSELGPKPTLYFNAGMFNYEPSLSTYDDLLKRLKISPPTAFAEQDILNMFFKDIYVPIPPMYNFLLAMLWRHPEKIELDKVKVVHYCAAGSKPWRYTGEEENMDREDVKVLVNKWGVIYNDETLEFKRMRTKVEAVGGEAKGVKVALTEAGGVHYVVAPSAA